MMIIGTSVIFFLTFTTINTFNPPCEDNPDCICLAIKENQVKVICKSRDTTKYTINIKSRNNLQIICKDWDGWENFNFVSKLTGTIINSLEFQNCGFSDHISFKDVMKQLGVEETYELNIKSFENPYYIVNRKYYEGFESVRKLDLAFNNLYEISNDFWLNFPNLEWLDLSDNYLVLPLDIFDTIPNLKQLELYNNQLGKIDPRLFDKLEKLEYLDIGDNNLVELDDHTFDKLSSLTSLNLRYNVLLELSSTIFYPLKKLEALDLTYNNLTYIPSQLFESNNELITLLFHDNENHLGALPVNMFSNLTKLEKVLMKSNGITFLPESLFWDSPLIKLIILNGNLIKTLPKDIFKGLRDVEELLLSNNLIETLPDGIFKDMENLGTLDLSFNLMYFITKDLFEGLTSLTKLNMENNRLKYIEQTALKHMVLLRVAKFAHNQLIFNNTNAQFTPFHSNRFLEELYLSFNNIQSFFSDWQTSRYNLKVLDLSNNNISTLSTRNLLIPLSSLRIDLRFNQIRSILFDNDRLPSSYLTKKWEIVVLIDGNPLLCDCRLYNLLRLSDKKITQSNYKFLKFELGNLSCVSTDGTAILKVTELKSTTYKCLEDDYFQMKNNCQIGCTCSVRPNDKTRILDCSNKKMSKFVIDVEKMTFVDNYPLILNLTGNILTEIPSLEPLKSIRIKGLLLSNNNINKITLDKLPKNLATLELHNNNITKINPRVLDYLNSKFLKKFTFSGNPITCNCYSQDLLHFVQIKRFFFKDLDNLKCKNMDLPMHEMTREQLTCESNLTMHIIIAIIVLILFTALFFIWRYKRQLLSMIRNNRQQFTVHFTRIEEN